MSGSIYLMLQSYTVPPRLIPALPFIADSGPDNAKPRRVSLRGFARSGSSLMLDVELKWHLHELLNFLTPDLRRRESHTGERILHGGGER